MDVSSLKRSHIVVELEIHLEGEWPVFDYLACWLWLGAGLFMGGEVEAAAAVMTHPAPPRIQLGPQGLVSELLTDMPGANVVPRPRREGPMSPAAPPQSFPPSQRQKDAGGCQTPPRIPSKSNGVTCRLQLSGQWGPGPCPILFQ